MEHNVKPLFNCLNSVLAEYDDNAVFSVSNKLTPNVVVGGPAVPTILYTPLR